MVTQLKPLYTQLLVSTPFPDVLLTLPLLLWLLWLVV